MKFHVAQLALAYLNGNGQHCLSIKKLKFGHIILIQLLTQNVYATSFWKLIFYRKKRMLIGKAIHHTHKKLKYDKKLKYFYGNL